MAASESTIGSRAGKRVDLVTAPNFLLATRESGYKSSSLAVAELVDNAIQAGATGVDIRVRRSDDADHPIEILVLDDGEGMDALTVARALSFGGSTRFNDRRSLGRYGMGLPNGGLSRARRIEVFTWQGESVLYACLDIDELIRKRRRSLARVESVDRPEFVPQSDSGTAIRLARCDRLEYRRASTLARRLEEDLSRIYRHYLGDRFALSVNGHALCPVDPLFLGSGARQFGDTLEYRLNGSIGVGKVTVVFAELPIEDWQQLSPDEKRRRGITGAPPVSIVRADREVDRGWFFMGSKRRENYDDWWRCEIRFEPLLDEEFGITNAKQAIRPSQVLKSILEPDLEAVARALNKRVRRRFELLKVGQPVSAAVVQASKAYSRLPPLPASYRSSSGDLIENRDGAFGRAGSAFPYEILVGELDGPEAFEFAVIDSRLILTLNSRHPLYRDLYEPLASSDLVGDRATATRVALAVLAAAHTEAGAAAAAGASDAPRLRAAWANVLAAFFNA